MVRRHHHEPAALLTPKKIRRWLFRLVLIGLAGAAVVMAKPDLVQNPKQRAQVEQLRDHVLEANIEGQEKVLQVLGTSVQTAQGMVGKASQVTYEVTRQDPQELINKTVVDITNQVKDLPSEQVKKIKLEFCRDVMDGRN